MSTFTVQRPLPVAVPRGARVAAALALRLLGWIEARAAARAERRRLAIRLGEAAAVRLYAQRHAVSDPRFSADLLAAADRHERQA